MWQGIEVEDGGQLSIIQNSYIEHALQAVHATYSNCIITDSKFDNNYDGLLFAGNGSAAQVGSTCDVSNNVFSNDAGTLPPPHANETSRYGIFALGIDDVTIGSGNTFKNLGTGIMSWMSNIKVEHCAFENLVYQPNRSFMNSVGIYAQGDFGIGNPGAAQYRINVFGQGKDALTPDFKNLHIGIYLRNMSSRHIIDNYMDNIQYGVRAVLCHGAGLNINTNRYSNVQNTGVLLSNNVGAHVLVANSNFTAYPLQMRTVGVDVFGFTGDESNLIIGLNRMDNLSAGVYYLVVDTESEQRLIERIVIR